MLTTNAATQASRSYVALHTSLCLLFARLKSRWRNDLKSLLESGAGAYMSRSAQLELQSEA